MEGGGGCWSPVVVGATRYFGTSVPRYLVYKALNIVGGKLSAAIKIVKPN